MKISTNKTTATFIALFLMATIAATLVALPNARAAEEFPTYAFLSIAPNPVGVNQETLLTFWIDKMPPSILGSWYDVWEGFTVKVTKPDETTSTLGPFKSDPVGNSWTNYTPDKIGNYTFQFNFPGMWKNATTFNRYYMPSTSIEVTLNDNRKYTAEIIGTDPSTDLAVFTKRSRQWV